MDQPKLSCACDFIAGTDATGTDNTSCRVEQHIGTEIFFRRNILNLKISTLAAAMVIAEILEVALACLVANGTIKRMVNEQKLKDILPRPSYTGESVRTIKSYFPSSFRSGGAVRTVLCNRLRVGGLEQPCPQAERRHGAPQGTYGSLPDGSTRMVAVVRHFNAVLFRSLNDIGSVFNFNFKVVQFNECHDVLIMQRVRVVVRFYVRSFYQVSFQRYLILKDEGIQIRKRASTEQTRIYVDASNSCGTIRC